MPAKMGISFFTKKIKVTHYTPSGVTIANKVTLFAIFN